VWELPGTATGAPLVRIARLPAGAWWANSCVFAPDGRTLAAFGTDRLVQFWDVPSRQLLGVFAGHAGTPWEARFTAAGVDGVFTLFDTHTGRPLITLGRHETMAMSVDFSADGRRLAGSSTDGCVRIWNLDRFDEHIAGNVPR
jgi:WD40 repeat protein